MFLSYFAAPELLALLAVLPIVASFLIFAYVQRKRALAELGVDLHFRKGVLLRPRVRLLKTMLFLAGLFLLALASARPQWGVDPRPPLRVGKDVVLVLDLSRSMLAEQPSRREVALRALRNLADTFAHRGGNRVALIVFAARARLLFPLTQDYDHLKHTLAQIEADDIPSLFVDQPLSGTRFGAAFKLAVQSAEARAGRRPAIVLLSDGDDPVDDDEWAQGVSSAVKARLPIYVFGIGDPNAGHTIPVGKERLEFEGQPIHTQSNEVRLREIARRTGGAYFPFSSYALNPPLGPIIQYLLDADTGLAEQDREGSPPLHEQRYTWFLVPAVALFMLMMCLMEAPVSRVRRGPAAPPRAPAGTRPRWKGFFSPLRAMALVGTALSLISAAPGDRAQSSLRQGNEAFALRDYELAMKHYDEAQGLTLDPGQVAFNKAIALYRQGKYRPAITCCRQCLEDDAVPPSRRARALFILGNALLQQANEDPAILAEAAAAYRACLRQIDDAPDLGPDVRHNFELARILLLRARDEQLAAGPSKDPTTSPAKDDGKNEKGYQPGKDPTREGAWTPIDPRHGDKTGAAQKPAAAPRASDTLTSGTIQILPDQEAVRPLSPADTLRTLEQEARRIAELRRQQRHPPGPASLSTKDW